MQTYNGKSVYGGIAIGKIWVYNKNKTKVKRVKCEDYKKETERFLSALNTADKVLEKLYLKAKKDVGETNAAIFDIHRMMLKDDDFVDSIKNFICANTVNAEYAVLKTGDKFAEIFSSMSDAYMRERAQDVKDVSNRIISILTNQTEPDMISEPRIIIADDLAPSETVQLDKDNILSFVTVKGSENSHTTILARSMNIPCVIQCDIELNDDLNGKTAVVDGVSGIVYISPDAPTLDIMREKLYAEKEKHKLLTALRNLDDVTKDGKKINLYANISNIKDLPAVIENDAQGIGLFRSEFIFLDKTALPSEDEQFVIYKTVAETMANKQVIIRTLDIGADKSADYLNLANEENPAMGYRAIRLCIKRPDIFKTQLKAIFRAALYGNIAVMYPMITSMKEIMMINDIVNETQEELKKSNTPYRLPKQGIMIETPAAAIISDELAGHVDFFSIGTNDLSQYVMAIDRQNPYIGDFFETHSKAVLRLIKYIVESAHKHGIWAGICGELASDPELTEFFIKIGVDELSVSPPQVLKIRQIIRETDTRNIPDFEL